MRDLPILVTPIMHDRLAYGRCWACENMAEVEYVIRKAWEGPTFPPVEFIVEAPNQRFKVRRRATH